MFKLENHWLSLVIFTFSILIGLSGLNWGIPSSESLSFYPLNKFKESTTDVEIYQIGPLESLHPDEGNILNALSNMKPSEFNFNPNFFNYPSFHIYLVGSILKIGQVFNIIELKNNRDFYLKNPHEFGKLFSFGRLLSIFMGSLTAILLFYISNNLFNKRVSIISPFVLLLTPLWVRNIHFMQVNVPLTFWTVLTIYFLTVYLKSKSANFLILSSLASGIATATKYTGSLFIFMPFLFFLKNREKSKVLCLKILCLPILVFILSNPYIFVSLGDFFKDLTLESNKLSKPSLVYLFTCIAISNSTFSLILFLLGIIISLKKINDQSFQILFLWFSATSIIPIISAHNNWGLIRYLIPVLPTIAIFISIAIDKIYIFINQFIYKKSLIYLVPILLLIPSFMYSFDVIRILSKKDIRLESSAWIEDNI